MTKEKEITLFDLDLERIDDIKKFVDYRNENKKEDEEDLDDFTIYVIRGKRDRNYIDIKQGHTTFEIRTSGTTQEEGQYRTYELKKVRHEKYLVTNYFDISYQGGGKGVQLLSVTDTVTKTFLEEEEE